jgi:hypothetical protein
MASRAPTAMRAIIKPYSTMVAPESSLKKFRIFSISISSMIFCFFYSLFFYWQSWFVFSQAPKCFLYHLVACTINPFSALLLSPLFPLLNLRHLSTFLRLSKKRAILFNILKTNWNLRVSRTGKRHISLYIRRTCASTLVIRRTRRCTLQIKACFAFSGCMPVGGFEKDCRENPAKKKKLSGIEGMRH